MRYTSRSTTDRSHKLQKLFLDDRRRSKAWKSCEKFSSKRIVRSLPDVWIKFKVDRGFNSISIPSRLTQIVFLNKFSSLHLHRGFFVGDSPFKIPPLKILCWRFVEDSPILSWTFSVEAFSNPRSWVKGSVRYFAKLIKLRNIGTNRWANAVELQLNRKCECTSITITVRKLRI